MRKQIQFAGLVVLLTLCGCEGTNSRITTRLNQQAALTGDLPLNPLQGKVITSWIDKSDTQHPTMSTLYGNDVAIQFARANASQNYPAGSVLSLVTWNQQEDERWFGGNIPASAKSVEIVSVTATPDHNPSYAYERYEGKPLKKTLLESGETTGADAKNLLSQRAAVLP
jgi:cytochrome P460